MTKYTPDPRTVEFDWQEHLAICEECRVKKNSEHYDRVKWMAEKYPLSCATCGGAVEERAMHCYHVVNGAMCRGTRLYFRAHQARPT